MTKCGGMKWEQVALGDVCEFRRGLTYKKSDEVLVSKNAILRANNITVETGEINFDEIRFISDEIDIPLSKKVIPGCLLVCTASGSKKHLGKIGIVEADSNYAFGGFMGILVPTECVLPKYLFYLTRSDLYRDFIDALSDGMNINNLKWSQLSQFQVSIPPLPEQKRIVAVLDEAFAAIATATANTMKNIANAQELFDSELHRLFSQKSDGRVKKKLGESGITQTGTTPKTSHKENFGEFIPFIKPGNFRKDGSLDYNHQGLSETGLGSCRLIKSGSVLMVCIGATIGKVGFTDRDICVNQQINACTPTNNISPKYIYYQMLTSSFQRLVKVNAGQTTLPIINKAKWSNISVLIPPLPEQKRIVAFLDKLSAEKQTLVDIYGTKALALAELKQSLLHQAFTGELTSK